MGPVPQSACLLESEHLVLEPLRADHAEEMAPLLDDVALHRFIGGAPDTREELKRRYERQAGARSPDGRECWLNWIVRVRGTGRAVGTVQATVKRTDAAVVADVAWVIGTSHQRQGFAQEAAQAMVEWLLERAVQIVIAHVHPGHEASMAVARKIGLMPTDTVVDGEVRWRRDAPGWDEQQR